MYFIAPRESPSAENVYPDETSPLLEHPQFLSTESPPVNHSSNLAVRDELPNDTSVSKEGGETENVYGAVHRRITVPRLIELVVKRLFAS